MHYISDRTRRVAFAKNDGDLAICHHTPARDLADKVVNLLTVIFIIDNIHFLYTAQYRSRGSAVTAAAYPF
jgi:hypothetical protein